MTETFIDKLNEHDDLLETMLKAPDGAKKKFVQTRREQQFRFMWEHTSMDKTEVLCLVKKREADFIQEWNPNSKVAIPEWIQRCEAQDAIIDVMHQKFKEEGML